ncbi:MAG: YcjX family protein, partial [Alphaproteobacteria bacterium]
FIQPGDMEGSPALTFAPMSEPKPASKISSKSLYAEMERRFEHYKAKVIAPFFRNHFSRLDRQIVLADILGAANAGLESVEELEKALAQVQSTMRPGSSSWIGNLLFGRRIDHILFAATKSDHLASDQHQSLTSLLQGMTLNTSNQAAFKGANVSFLALSALRATTEVTIDEGKTSYRCLKGKLVGQSKEEAVYTGKLPSDLNTLKRQLKDQDSSAFAFHKFQPPAEVVESNLGLANIRMDKALEFLLGDLLK